MKKDITELYCFVDDFVTEMEEELKKHQISNGQKNVGPNRIPGLSIGEIMTITLMFHESPCKNFKYFYESYLQLYKSEFPLIPSYDRFISLMPRALPYMGLLLYSLLSPGKGISYIDSTSLAVCHPKRINRNKVFKGMAKLSSVNKPLILSMI